MARKHMKGCSMSLAIRETNVKTTQRYHYIPIRMAKIKKVTAINADKDKEKLDNSHIAVRNVKWYSLSGKQLGVFLQNETCKYRVAQ